MTYDKLVVLQVQDEATEEWSDALHLHARVNKYGGSMAQDAGADQYRLRLSFEFRYTEALARVAFNTQPYRLVYRGRHFKVTDYDDYMERHLTIKLAGLMYE